LKKEKETENPISYIHRMEFGEKKYIKGSNYCSFEVSFPPKKRAQSSVRMLLT
jgi:hypothetical protein